VTDYIIVDSSLKKFTRFLKFYKKRVKITAA